MENSNEYSNLPAGIITHFYGLISNDAMDKNAALKLAQTKTYDELDKLTHLDWAIMLGVNLIVKSFFVDFTADSIPELVRGDLKEAGTGYFLSLGSEIWKCHNRVTKYPDDIVLKMHEFHDKIIKCISDLHDAWVVNNTKIDNDKNLYMFLPLELGGNDELDRAAMWMAAFFGKFDLEPLGELNEEKSWKFECTKNIRSNFNRYTKKFLQNNNVTCEDDLRRYLKNIGTEYDALKVGNAPKGKMTEAKARLALLTKESTIDKLLQQILENNPTIFSPIITSANRDFEKWLNDVAAKADRSFMSLKKLVITRLQISYFQKKDVITPAEISLLKPDIDNFIKGMPMERIFGYKVFFYHSYSLKDEVYLPKSETEELVKTAVAIIDDKPCTVLDLGCGAGVIGITLAQELPHCKVVMSDNNKNAIELTLQNMAKNDVNAEVIHTAYFDKLGKYDFSYVVCNPPHMSTKQAEKYDLLWCEYCDFEPTSAIFAGTDGLSFYKELLHRGKDLLKKATFILQIDEEVCNGVKTIFQNYNVKIINNESNKPFVAIIKSNV